MFLNETLLHTIQFSLRKFDIYYKDIHIISQVHGGSINECYKLQSRDHFFFLKVNNAGKFPMMFLCENEGLKKIRETGSIKVPQTIAFGEDGGEQYLLMKWIDKGQNNKQSQQLLGRGLARLHKNYGDAFGLDHNNYMGSLHQKNSLYSTWSEFYINNRLVPQIELAEEKGLLSSSLIKSFQKLFIRLQSLFPVERPSLVHGDLWSGNFMINSDGDPILIDPAVSYCHREVDIAMTNLFGGFDPLFYSSYNEEYPMEQGWKERIDLWNLYPLLVHVNLFGNAYLNELTQALRKYL